MEIHSRLQLHGNLTKTGNSPWLKIFPLFANEHSKINCEMPYLVMDLQILGPKKVKPWLHIHFHLALAQDVAEEEHPPRHPDQLPFPVP